MYVLTCQNIHAKYLQFISGACISEDRGLYVKGMYSAYIQDGGTGQIKLKQTRWGVKARVNVCVILFKFNELFKKHLV